MPEPIRVTMMKYKMDGIGILPQHTFQQIGVLTIETGEIDMFTDGAFHHTLEAVSDCGKQLINGSNDYADIMAAVDKVLVSEEWIDSTRLGVTGGSYDGLMTNWIVGHTDQFKVAETQRPISNWISFFGVSHIGYYFSDWQLKAKMTDVEKLWQHSPLKYAEQVNTALLILHSEKDDRCPIEQASNCISR